MVLGDNLHTGIILTKKSPKSTTLIGKDSIYRTKVIVRKPVWTPARRPPAIHNHIIRPRLETGVLKFLHLFMLLFTYLKYIYLSYKYILEYVITFIF
jgi:hypothetical protein